MNLGEIYMSLGEVRGQNGCTEQTLDQGPKYQPWANIYASFRNPNFRNKQLIVQMTQLLNSAVGRVFQQKKCRK